MVNTVAEQPKVVVIQLDATKGSELLNRHFMDESNEYRCDRLLMSTLDFSNTYYSMDEFIRVLGYLRKNRFFSQIVLKAVGTFPYVVTMCTPEMMTTDFVRELIGKNVFCYNFLDMAYYYNDREIVLEIIGITSQCQIMDKISEELQNDKTFIIQAINRNYKCFYYLNDRMKSDREVVLCVVSKDGYLLGDVDKQYANDEQVVITAVKTTNSAIIFASPKLREDREFFKNYILPFSGSLFKYAHIMLRNDCNYISEIIVNFPQCIQYAGSNIQGDVDFIIDLIKINPKIVTYVNWQELLTPYSIQKITQQLLPFSVIRSIYDSLDNEYIMDSFVMNSIKRNPKTLQLFTLHNTCLQFVEMAIELNGLTLEYADSSLKVEKELVRKACQQNPNSFKFAAPLLRQDLEFVSELIDKIHPIVLLHSCLNPKTQKDLIAKTMVQYPKLLRDVYW